MLHLIIELATATLDIIGKMVYYGLLEDMAFGIICLAHSAALRQKTANNQQRKARSRYVLFQTATAGFPRPYGIGQTRHVDGEGWRSASKVLCWPE